MKKKYILISVLALLGIFGLFTLFNGLVDSHHLEKEKEWENRDLSLKQLDLALKDLARQIQSTQGEGSCNKDNECRIVGLGTPVCGKYKNFLVYSIEDTNEPALLSLVKEFNSKHQKLSDMSLKANECGKDPLDVRCIQHQCNPIKRN